MSLSLNLRVNGPPSLELATSDQESPSPPVASKGQGLDQKILGVANEFLRGLTDTSSLVSFGLGWGALRAARSFVAAKLGALPIVKLYGGLPFLRIAGNIPFLTIESKVIEEWVGLSAQAITTTLSLKIANSARGFKEDWSMRGVCSDVTYNTFLLGAMGLGRSAGPFMNWLRGIEKGFSFPTNYERVMASLGSTLGVFTGAIAGLTTLEQNSFGIQRPEERMGYLYLTQPETKLGLGLAVTTHYGIGMGLTSPTLWSNLAKVSRLAFR